MSLLRLLATGRSLVGMKDGNSPYRMCTKNLLPNFGATRNPFMPGSKAEPAPEAVPAKPAEPENLSLFDADLKPVVQPSVKTSHAPATAMKPLVAKDETPIASSISRVETVIEPKPVEVIKTTPLEVEEVNFAPMEQERFAGGRMKDRHSLVEFGSVETALLPVRLNTLAPMAEVLPPVAETSAAVEEKPVVEPVPVAPIPVVRKVEKFVAAPEIPPAKRPMRRPVRASGFSRWLAKMNPKFLFAGWGKVGSNRPTRTRPPEQAEFLLAQVKPLRNELNDSDLQVVTTTVNQAETKAGEPKTEDQPARNALTAGTGPWNRLTRIFSEDHIQTG